MTNSSRFSTRMTRRAAIAGIAATAGAIMAPARMTQHAAAQGTPVPAAAPDEQVKVTVALDWYPNSNHAGLFLAKERGWFAEEGIDIDLYTPADPTTVLQTVGAGKDTFGISYQTDVLLARAQEIPVVSVAAISQVPLQGIMVLDSSSITRPADLKGKTVGYPGIPSQEAFLATMLANDNLTMSDVDLVNVGFDLTPALVSGRADAALGAFWAHETIVAERAGYPVEMLKVEDFGVPSYYELVLVASETTVADDPDLVKRFLRAVARGYAAAAEDPEAALDALAKASPDLDRAVETEGIALVIPTWTEGDVPFGTQTAERWTDYAEWMASQGLIPTDLDATKAFVEGMR
jgi:putative hydroxymethylpyrimidine transport system substrate-binding protein